MMAKSFAQLSMRCDDLQPIDYFFAKNLSSGYQFSCEDDEHWSFLVIVALSWAQRQGHSCLPLSRIADATLWDDPVSGKKGYRFPALNALEGIVSQLVSSMSSPAPLVLKDHCLYTARAFNFEQTLMQRLSNMHRIRPIAHQPQTRVAEFWPQLFPHSHDQSNLDWQQVAVITALHQPLLMLTGGPGTGKTYTVSRLLMALQLAADDSLQIGLAAPTGKAAQRLSESIQANMQALKAYSGLSAAVQQIPRQASTVHRLLGLREGSVRCRHDHTNPLPLDVLVVDECSMLDLALFTRLIRAVPDHCRLILIGDAAQLPSVESGNVLPMLQPHPSNQLSALQKSWLMEFQVPVDSLTDAEVNTYAIELQQSKRFDQSLGDIASQIQRSINQPKQARSTWENYLSYCDTSDRFEHANYAQFEAFVRRWIEGYYAPLASQPTPIKALRAAQQFRLLCVTRQGPMGVENLNQLIDSTLKRRANVALNQSHFHGRLVMITKNLASLGLYNGDIGIVWRDARGKLAIHFSHSNGEETREFSPERVIDLESVFAMTVHKSQGSEYQHVAVVIPQQGADRLLTNELLYTGITRSRERLTLVCDRARFVECVTQKTQRWSGVSPFSSVSDATLAP